VDKASPKFNAVREWYVNRTLQKERRIFARLEAKEGTLN